MLLTQFYQQEFLELFGQVGTLGWHFKTCECDQEGNHRSQVSHRLYAGVNASRGIPFTPRNFGISFGGIFLYRFDVIVCSLLLVCNILAAHMTPTLITWLCRGLICPMEAIQGRRSPWHNLFRCEPLRHPSCVDTPEPEPSQHEPEPSCHPLI